MMSRKQSKKEGETVMRMQASMMRVVAVVAFIVTAIAASSVRAEFLQPFYVRASSTYYQSSETLVVGPGLSEESATATHNNLPADMWITDNTSTASLDFYLNSQYDLTDIYFWAYNWGSDLGRGVKDFTVQVSTNRGGTWLDPTSGTSQIAAQGGGTGAEPVQTLTMTAAGVNAVRFNITSNYAGTDSFTGISDVGLETTTPLRPALPTNDYVTGVSIEAVSSAYSGSDANNVINGDGFELNGPGSHTTAVTDMWLSNTGDFTDGTPPFLTFDLGANCNLDSILVWNSGQTLSSDTPRGAKDVEIEVADSDVGLFSSLGTFEFFRAPPSATWGDYSQSVDLSGFALADDVRRVRFTIHSNCGDAGYVGLSEVRFVSPPPAVAPGTLIHGR